MPPTLTPDAHVAAGLRPDGPSAGADQTLVQINAPQPFLRGFTSSVRDIWTYRELLVSLVRKELKVKYKGSVLGFFWTLLRPLMLLLVYYIAIGKFLKSPIPDYVVFLFSGLIAWTLFSDVVVGATSSITGNAGLVKKVYFPREIMPLAVVGSALVQFGFMLVVLVGAILVTGHAFDVFTALRLVPLALVDLVVFMTAIGLLVSAVNVYLRDTQHLIEIVLLLFFWMTPIVYGAGTVLAKIDSLSHTLLVLYLASPMTVIVTGFQRGIYQTVSDHGNPLLYGGPVLIRELYVLVGSTFLLWLSQRIFARAQGNFAQEL